MRFYNIFLQKNLNIIFNNNSYFIVLQNFGKNLKELKDFSLFCKKNNFLLQKIKNNQLKFYFTNNNIKSLFSSDLICLFFNHFEKLNFFLNFFQNKSNLNLIILSIFIQNRSITYKSYNYVYDSYKKLNYETAISFLYFFYKNFFFKFFLFFKFNLILKKLYFFNKIKTINKKLEINMNK